MTFHRPSLLSTCASSSTSSHLFLGLRRNYHPLLGPLLPCSTRFDDVHKLLVSTISSSTLIELCGENTKRAHSKRGALLRSIACWSFFVIQGLGILTHFFSFFPGLPFGSSHFLWFFFLPGQAARVMEERYELQLFLSLGNE